MDSLSQTFSINSASPGLTDCFTLGSSRPPEDNYAGKHSAWLAVDEQRLLPYKKEGKSWSWIFPGRIPRRQVIEFQHNDYALFCYRCRQSLAVSLPDLLGQVSQKLF
jgi:hypothetical protein